MKIASSSLAVLLAVPLSGPIAWAQNAQSTAIPAPTPQLRPTSNAPITLHVNDDAKNIYLAIGKLAGINVLFDPDYQPRKAQIDFTSVSLSDALRIVGQVTRTFYKPMTPDTIYVAANTRQEHNDLDDLETRIIHLKFATQQADANEIVTALRNILPPEAKVYLVASQEAIVMRTTPEWLTLAQKVLGELDVQKKSYRLTYTVIDMDGNKPVSTEHYSMVMAAGQYIKLKQGSKVPIATRSYNTGATDTKPAGVQTQFTYLDVGMNFDANLQTVGNGAMLKSTVERSSIATGQSGVGPQDPIVRQTLVQGVYYLALGKPVKLGSVEIAGTTHHLDVEATLEELN